MAESKGTSTPKLEKDAPPSEAWTLKEFWGKTVWDWMQLLGVLAIPVVLTVGGCVFNAQQDARQQQLEAQRAEAERELAEQRTQDEALQAYLDQMSTLMLEKDLRNSEENSEVRTLARARTATVIQRLDVDGNQNVILFLYEAKLTGNELSSISLLAGADLRGARLEGIDLSTMDLRGTYLKGAHLNKAYMWGAYLSDAYLSGADLRHAYLHSAGLRNADLRNADLRHADLIGADLSGANLSGADLREVHLRLTDLSDADLSGANLHGADLLPGERITNKELLHKTGSLKGATMPNGQKYEDWVEGREPG